MVDSEEAKEIRSNIKKAVSKWNPKTQTGINQTPCARARGKISRKKDKKY
jgi:hypothetical protein